MQNTCNPYFELPRKRGNPAKYTQAAICTTKDMREPRKIRAIRNPNYHSRAGTMQNTCNPLSQIPRKRRKHSQYTQSDIWPTKDVREPCKMLGIRNLNYHRLAGTLQNTYNPYSELPRKRGNHAKYSQAAICTTKDVREPCKIHAIRNLKSHESAFWSLLMHSEAFWSNLKHSEAFWCILKPSNAFWSILMQSEAFWRILKPYDAFWRILMQSDVFWSILKHSYAL